MNDFKKLGTVILRPKRTQITVSLVTLAWAPTLAGSAGAGPVRK